MFDLFTNLNLFPALPQGEKPHPNPPLGEGEQITDCSPQHGDFTPQHGDVGVLARDKKRFDLFQFFTLPPVISLPPLGEGRGGALLYLQEFHVKDQRSIRRYSPC